MGDISATLTPNLLIVRGPLQNRCRKDTCTFHQSSEWKQIFILRPLVCFAGARFRQSAVQIRGLEKVIWSHSEGWWLDRERDFFIDSIWSEST